MSQIKYYAFVCIYIHLYVPWLGLTSEKDSPCARHGNGYKCTGARRDSVVSARNKGDKSGDRTTSVPKTNSPLHLLVYVAFLLTSPPPTKRNVMCASDSIHSKLRSSKLTSIYLLISNYH